MKNLILLLFIPFLSYAQEEIEILKNDKIRVSYSYDLIKENKKSSFYDITFKVQNLTGNNLYYLEKQENKSGKKTNIGYLDYSIDNVKSGLLNSVGKSKKPPLEGRETRFAVKNLNSSRSEEAIKSVKLLDNVLSIELSAYYKSIYSIPPGSITKNLTDQKTKKGIKPLVSVRLTSNYIVNDLSKVINE
tara:strand:- start:114 stop:680 length:567 start_codon:yes stop_codon:yes gene_type:complete